MEGKSCAIVGASGILQYSNFGTEIDAHDVVVRFGLPNLDKEISGVKTSILLINPSALFMSNTTALSQSILNGARQTVQVLNPKIISVNCCTRLCYEKVHKLKEDDFIFQHRNTTASACSYISEVTRHLKDKYNWTSSGSIPRSGLLYMFPFLENCKRVGFYGQWPFALDCRDKPVQYHYWEDAPGLINPVHDSEADFATFLRVVNVYENAHNNLPIELTKCRTDS